MDGYVDVTVREDVLRECLNVHVDVEKKNMRQR